MQDYMRRTANWLAYGMSLSEIRETLLANGLTEYQIFLTVKAAEILNNGH